MIAQETSIVFLSDAPPMENGGFGNSAVAFSVAKALDGDIRLILTRQHHWRNVKSGISGGLKVRTILFSDLSGVRGLRALSPVLRSCLDSLLFLAQIPTLLRELQGCRAKYIVALCGNDPFFLINAILLARFSRLALVFYMVDDFEASALMEGKWVRAHFFRAIEKFLLPKVDKVCVISAGYARLLKEKYGVNASLLPLPIRYPKINYSKARFDNNSRTIAFSGSVNALYKHALRNLCDVLDERNRQGEKWKVLFLGKANTQRVRDLIGNYAFIEAEFPASNVELVARLSECFVCFLPYSDTQNQAIRTMIQTAFPCKISEYFASGRPILAYAPQTSTIFEYFFTHKLPLCATTKYELNQALSKLKDYDSETLISAYQQVIAETHSPEAIRRFLNSLK